MPIRIHEILPMLLLATTSLWVNAQISAPVIRGKFGVDADVQNNWFNNAGYTLAGNDDWFFRNGTTATSTFVIDTAGAAAILAQYGMGIGLTTPFFRKMRYPSFSLVDGSKTMIDAIFVRDYHGADTTAFSLGSNKNGMSPAEWGCGYQPVPNKNDILDAYVHIRREGPTASLADTLWMFGGLALEATNGNRYFDFELYQSDILYTRSTNSFTGYGPDGGHTSWKFDAAGKVTQVGDIIFSADYGSSELSSIEARIWVEAAARSITPAAFNWTADFEPSSSNPAFGYAAIRPKTAVPFYFGTTNSTESWAGPFAIVRANNSVQSNYERNQFMEFGVNLTVLGLNPQSLMGVTDCGFPFSKLLVKTRSSTSFSAELKDFIGPYDLFLPPRALAVPDIPLFCGATGISQLAVTNPYATSSYTWTTDTGHIVGSSTGTSITVDEPGTYVVTQTLENGCPAYATDTIVILLDPACAVLTSNDVILTGALKNSMAQLNWSVQHNREIRLFTLEKSTDGIHFTLVATANPLQLQATYATYKTIDNVHGLNHPYVYYRLKLSLKNGMVVYSKVLPLAVTPISNDNISLQPNPVRDHLQINIYSTADRDVQVLIYNTTGQLMRTMNSRVKKGYAALTVSDLCDWPKGVYAIKLVSGKDSFVNRMILVK
ncbi:T9SS type A sorting domain-containing protein [Longitalea arenae]|uniref:T9SS type A sorting domain-containing protein n=1 Tax=Longitalea arenae TaxID=2812558 RepID=UPI0019672E1A|nr:T9SS type A sorting domain-containing protein [Longitalea arenae]